MPFLFMATLFVSALLLFLAELMIAKMVLPKFGGTPAVWNTCTVFFQALMLAGYGYAHAASAWLGTKRQAALQVLLLLLPFLVLPIAVDESWAPIGGSNPIPPLLGVLLIAVGLPFFLISTSAPLLQKWFTATGHPSARDPYFLYAASNLGSMIGLLGYPAIFEPTLTLHQQSLLWLGGYVLLVGLTIGCAVAVWRAQPVPPTPMRRHKLAASEEELARTTAPTWKRRLHWIALAFVPSSLMLGVTTYLSTDIAPIPLIWVIPLALYLLSFILVFSRLPEIVHVTMTLVLPVLVLLQVFLMLSETSHGMEMQIGLHLGTLFAAAMVCHGELARTRPPTSYLTEFYLWMSVGGVLGGMFNALVAPMVFKTVVEYPLVMIAACLLLPSTPTDQQKPERTLIDFIVFVIAPGFRASPVVLLFQRLFGSDPNKPPKPPRRWPDFVIPAALGLAAFAMMIVFLFSKDVRNSLMAWPALPEAAEGTRIWVLDAIDWMSRKCNWALDEFNQWFGEDPNDTRFFRIRRSLVYGLPILACYVLVGRSIRFGLGVAAIMVAGYTYMGLADDSVIYRDRSFFGVLKLEEEAKYHRLVHGTTLHGEQRIDEETKKPVRGGDPLTYYHKTGPLGDIFAAFKEEGRAAPIALIGLGTGTSAFYGQPGQDVTFYEIDPAVIHIAKNPDYFSYVTDAVERGAKLGIMVGDARLSLRYGAPLWHPDGEITEHEPAPDDGKYQFISVDAFSSDAIPIHLITREALALYLDKLAPDGIIAFHISNRYLDLEPVLANLAADVKPPLVALRKSDRKSNELRKAASTWVVLARNQEALATLAKKSGWEPIQKDPKVGVWTDDYSNLWNVFSFRK